MMISFGGLKARFLEGKQAFTQHISKIKIIMEAKHHLNNSRQLIQETEQ